MTSKPERRFLAVTTFNEAGYARYGRRFLAGFLAHWPVAVGLRVYYEGAPPEETDARLEMFDLEAVSPALVSFKARHGGNARTRGILEDGDYSYRWDAVRFTHKVHALAHAALDATVDADVLIWIDADTVALRDLPLSVLDETLPPGVYTAYLGREHAYPECGYVAYDLTHAANREFMEFWLSLYETDRLFELPEWHDSYVYDLVRRTFEAKGKFESHDIAAQDPPSDHPFVNSVLGPYLDHLKGEERKDAGASFEDDYVAERGGARD